MRLHHLRSNGARRGVVLLVVLALLTLFAVVAIAFVFFAEQEAQSARMGVQSETLTRPNADLLLVNLLNQLTVGTNNTESALRMNDLLTNMYGTSGNTPFNGMGRRVQYAGNVNTAYAVNEGRYYNESSHGAFNPPYSYPDENFPLLGAVGDPLMRNKIGDPNLLRNKSQVLFRSFVRPCLILDGTNTPIFFNPYDPTESDAVAFWRNQPMASSGANLSAEARRRMVPRPGQWDHPNFPIPADSGGDVRNLPPSWTVLMPNGATEFNGNDSYWVDFGFPVQKGPDGRYYKPLAAVFMMDLDGLLNANVHGNLFGTNNVSLSNHGLGPWEVNLNRLLTANLPSTTTPEWPRVMLGATTPSLLGRLGSPYTGGGTTAGPFVATTDVSKFTWVPIITPPYYAGLDVDASRVVAGNYIPSNRITFPDYTGAATNQLERFPRFSAVDGYNTRTNGGVNEAPNTHPLYYQYFRPAGDDRTFKAWNMRSLLLHGDTNTDAQYGDLRHLLENNFNTNPKARRLLTTHSHDVVRGGVTPWWYRENGNARYRYQLANGDLYPKGNDGTGSSAIPTPTSVPRYNAMEYMNNTWRANLPMFQPSNVINRPRVDVNRPLPAYPATDATGRILAANQPAFEAATKARQDLAKDIFNVLAMATGADPSGNQPEETNARRWLAQLAVNMVDQRDNDDYITPYNWTGNEWVYGTELPRVVINEAYAEFAKRDPGMPGKPGKGKKAIPPGQLNRLRWQVDVWAELYNPLHSDTALADSGGARLFIPETAANARDDIKCYRIVLMKPNAQFRDADEVLGDPMPNAWSTLGGQQCKFDFGPLDNLQPVTPAANNPYVLQPAGDYFTGLISGGMKQVPDENNPAVMEDRIRPDSRVAPERGFYLAGPTDSFPVSLDTNDNNKRADPDVPVPTLQKSTMSYVTGKKGDQNFDLADRPTIVLQRLLCPALPEQTKQNNPLYNPYITVDYMEDVLLNDGERADKHNNHAEGRRQPYAAHKKKPEIRMEQYAPMDENAFAGFPTMNTRNQPQHTFYRHNAVEELNYNANKAAGQDFDTVTVDRDQLNPNQTLKLPFDWLTHFDREYISAMELLQVSGYKPHELTQQFVVDVNGTQYTYAHRAPWLKDGTGASVANDTRLYRALEFLETRSRAAGVATHVIRGKDTVAANNTVQVELSTYDAANHPTGDAHWGNNGTADYVWGYGVNGGVWRIEAGTTLVVEPGTGQGETVRVTAVNAATQRITAYFTRAHTRSLSDPSLGGSNYYEILVPYMAGRVPGKINLNTVFDFETFSALLDTQQPNHFTQVNTTAAVAISNANAVNTVRATNWTMSGPNGVAWTFEVGSVLIVGSGASQEIVEVTNIDAMNQTFDAYFTRSHPNNAPIILDPAATMFRQMDIHRRKYLRPFRSLATGHVMSGDNQYFDNGSGIEDTLLRPGGLGADSTKLLFELPGANAHPWIKAEAMNKIMNNVTVRSNCFALWMTVGYFEVSGPQTYGTADVVVTMPPQSRTVNLPSRPSSMGIQVGTKLLIDKGSNLESVDVTAINDAAQTFTAMFSRSHTAPFPVNGTLQQEIGRADGKEIRHRFFAIIDRSVFEQWMLEAMVKDPANADISKIWGDSKLDPRKDNPINTSGNTYVTLPAPVVYSSRIE